MRIGIEAQRVFRKEKHGMDVYALELIRSLQEIDKANDYYVFAINGDDNECLSETFNFKIIRSSETNYPKWEQIILPRLIREFKIDVLHCTANTAPINTNVPLILTLHDVIYFEKLWVSGTLYQNFGNLYRRLIVPLIIKKTRRIITVSAHEKQSILNRLNNIPYNKVVVIHNGLKKDFGKEQTSGDTFCRQYKLPTKYFLFIGNTIERKNAARTILAHMNYLSKSEVNIPLVLPGLSEDFVRKVYQEKNLTYDTKSYYFPGYIPEQDLPNLFKYSFCFLFPSIREGFGLPIIEAMAAGVPVITSNTSSMPEVAGGAALLIDPYNITEIQTAMISVESDQVLRSQLIQKGMYRSLHFSWKSNAAQTLAIYQQCKMTQPYENL